MPNPVSCKKKNRKAYQGSMQVSSTNESGVCALAIPHTWVLLRSCRQREESPAIALPYCFSVFNFPSFFCFPGRVGRSKGEKMEFPDVSSFPCPSPYRGCGRWQFGNQIHHLMKPFHPSTTNIVESSHFLPPGMKKILIFNHYPESAGCDF
jgi:hypothetical protein